MEKTEPERFGAASRPVPEGFSSTDTFAALDGPGATVLVVEDEESVRSFLTLVLSHHGFQVLEAQDGQAALRLAAAYHGPIHVLLSDVVMPHMGGTELLRRLHVQRPTTRPMLVSGHSASTLAQHGVPRGIPCLQKPFASDELLLRVHQLLGTLAGC